MYIYKLWTPDMHAWIDSGKTLEPCILLSNTYKLAKPHCIRAAITYAQTCHKPQTKSYTIHPVSYTS